MLNPISILNSNYALLIRDLFFVFIFQSAAAQRRAETLAYTVVFCALQANAPSIFFLPALSVVFYYG